METVDSEDDFMMPQLQPQAGQKNPKHSSQQVCFGQHKLHITKHDMVCRLHRMLDQGVVRKRKLEKVQKKLHQRNR